MSGLTPRPQRSTGTNTCAYKAVSPNGKPAAILNLSRLKIVTRAQSATALDEFSKIAGRDVIYAPRWGDLRLFVIHYFWTWWSFLYSVHENIVQENIDVTDHGHSFMKIQLPATLPLF